jgi:hypothetical protein
MASGVFLINGATLPYYLIDTALGWAKENGAGLLGVFLFSDQRNAETYSFPSDIEQAETTVSEAEAEKDIEELIVNHARYVQRQGDAEGVKIDTAIMKDPEPEELLNELRKGDVLFTDPDTFKGPNEYAATSFLFEDIILLSPHIIEVRPK